MLEEQNIRTISSSTKGNTVPRKEAGGGSSPGSRRRRHRARRRKGEQVAKPPTLPEESTEKVLPVDVSKKKNTKKKRTWRNRRKKSSSSTDTSSKSMATVKDKKDKSHQNDNSTTKSEPELDARKWFDNLPTGGERASATAITDKRFIETYLHLLNNQQQRQSADSKEMPMVTESVSINDIATMFDDKLLVSRVGSVSNKRPSSQPLCGPDSFDSSNRPCTPAVPEAHRPPETNSSRGNVVVGDGANHNDKKPYAATVPEEDIESTAFRIRNNNNNNSKAHHQGSSLKDNIYKSQGNTKTLGGKCDSDSFVTTLHFKSGLSLPISGVSETDKNVIAILEKRDVQVQPNTPVKHVQKSKEENEVDQKLTFSALQSHFAQNTRQPKTTNTTIKTIKTPTKPIFSADSRKKKSQIISGSKTSAALAMSRQVGLESEFLNHVRLIFSAALQTKHLPKLPGKNGKDGAIEFLTLDPKYLNQRIGSSFRFLNDAQNLLDNRKSCINIGKTTNKPFTFLENDCNRMEAKDLWFDAVLHSGADSPKDLLLLLLAKVEVSIRASHKRYMRESHKPLGSDSKKASEIDTNKGADIQNIVSALSDDLSSLDLFSTPPEMEEDVDIPVNFPIAGLDHHDSKSDLTRSFINSSDLFLSLDNRISFPQSRHTAILSSMVDNHETTLHDMIQQILSFWSRVSSAKENRDRLVGEVRQLLRKYPCDLSSEKNAASLFEPQDLILVPLSWMSFMSASTANTADSVERENFVHGLSSRWNKIISSSLHLVNQALESPGSQSNRNNEKKTKVDATTKVEDDLFFLAEPPKPSGKSKKKKKKKKKRKQSTSANNSNNANIAVTAKVVENAQSGAAEMSLVDNQTNIEKNESSICRKDSSEIVPEASDCAVSVATMNSEVKPDKKEGVLDQSTSVSGQAPLLSTDITVSRINGVCVIGGARVEEEDNDNSDAWETVEHKGGRGNIKNKNSARPSSKNGTEQQAVSSPSGGRKKGKSKSHRQRTARRKLKDVKEYLYSVYDTVGDKVSEKCTDSVPDRMMNRISDLNGSMPRNSRAASLRDVVVGNLPTYKPLKLKPPTVQSTPTLSIQKPLVSRTNKDGVTTTSLKSGKKTADQSTAPTLPETLSGISAATHSSSNTEVVEQLTSTLEKRVANKETQVDEHISKPTNVNSENIRDELTSNASTGAGEEPASRCTATISKSSAPPVQTLIGGNTNSTTSSVASSLEAPHRTRRSARRHSPDCKEDVGYHLLKVCERLSIDINTFMGRRASALDIRRRERSALLGALQDTVQSIWAGNVETYGSCATKLDLPSSDLDVVICGLDNSMNDEELVKLPHQQQQGSSPRRRSCSTDSAGSYMSHQFYQPLSINGHRVLRLSSELELQPWAVQVKAIPTATVPVIKILADPLRLPGAVGTMDWMLHQQQLAAEMNSAHVLNMEQQSETNDKNRSGTGQNLSSRHSEELNSSRVQYRTSSPPWRGADVMNGLVPLDITFEGPEHGGLGSTDFSNRVVKEACNEVGLAPENTPAVQVIMVLKELLAQRRLNEPFSGGLSSYAILLLVVAVIKERRIIREELERVERQQRAVTSDSSVSHSFDKDLQDGTDSLSQPPPPKDSQKSNNMTTPKPESVEESSKNQPPIVKVPVRVNSWAAIAKKSNTSSKSNGDTTKEVIAPPRQSSVSLANETSTSHVDAVSVACREKSKENSANGNVEETPISSKPHAFPQGSNDVLEVLCSGEPTAGKLFMHFLLFYGRHFDPQTTSIDVRGTHHPEFSGGEDGLNCKAVTEMIDHLSPFIPRKAGGSYNPVTEVYTVDPVVVYDPLMGAESNNVARSCYAWGTIRWVFEQCFNTLSGVVERGPRSNSNSGRRQGRQPESSSNISTEKLSDSNTDIEEVSPLLELLLSF